MNLISKYKAESAKYDVLAKKAEYEAAADLVLQLTSAAQESLERKNLLAQSVEALQVKVAELKANVEPTNEQLQVLEARTNAELKVACESGRSADFIRAHKLQIELGELKKDAITKAIEYYEQVGKIDDITPEYQHAEAEAAIASVAVKDAIKKSTELKSAYESAQTDFDSSSLNHVLETTSTLNGQDPFVNTAAAVVEDSMSYASVLESIPKHLRLSVKHIDENLSPISTANIDRGVESKYFEDTTGKDLQHAHSLIEEQKAEMETNSKTQRRLASSLNTANKKINDLSRDLDEVSSIRNGLEVDLVKSKAENDGNLQKMEEHLKQKEQLESDLKDAQAQIELLLHDLKSSKSSATIENHEESKLAESLASITAKHEFEVAINAKLTDDIRILHAKVRELRDSSQPSTLRLLSEADSQSNPDALEAAKLEIVELTNALNLFKDEKKALEVELESMKATTSNLPTVVESSMDGGHENHARTTSTSSTQDELSTVITDLKDKIENMMPLYEVGVVVRSRRLEFCKPRMNQSRELIRDGFDAALGGLALADATMFLDKAVKSYGDVTEYEKAYGVSAASVWENRDFTMMLNVLSMRMNVNTDRLRFNSARENIMIPCNKFMTNTRVVTSDEGVKENSLMLEWYQSMKNAYDLAWSTTSQHKSTTGIRKPSTA